MVPNTRRDGELGRVDDEITVTTDTDTQPQETEPLLRSVIISEAGLAPPPASDAVLLDEDTRENKTSSIAPIVILALVRLAEPTAITQVNSGHTESI